ncbi:PTS fructose transporter subunit IIC [Vibrio splendidus]|uniref:protein-N(pi)-phosphohistidine--D-fructose phosphotransferase n=1 Tax=Vibrio splendidus TaxID=29497 RepID=A0A2T5F021_VIBSP|nr:MULTISPECIES: fructose-specific PTS transporter subunit EIIC [Vibrio]MCC4878397.1 fructose-specific PTS transporter subunit EIIC [Vibrio splendidus]OEF68697.1 PTS lactose transporter subunit IIB [Vibrio splendidus 1F-157]PMJ53122.1 PTS lactose transporter subunit IIB [Vibrio splendidus]PTO71040.1 PTS lactose transporter subunit IIB [Vibrio splendidus]PTP28419.1 PTS lactose transporter subunit IIB [Vibrio splendidus]
MAKKKLVAVTACPTGIAHTFMAAKKIQSWAEKQGYEVKVETQGSDGVKNKLTAHDIATADGVVLAVDVPIMDMERFDNANPLQVRTQELIKRVDDLLPTVFLRGKEKSDVDVEIHDEKRSAYQVAIGHIMTGISYMLPVVVLGGLLMAVAKITGEFVDISGTPIETLDKLGFMTIKFMYPIFAGYLAYSIAGKPALIPAFIGGLMTDEPYKRFFDLEGWAPSGFFGAIAIGFIVGYLVRYLNDVIRVRTDLTTLKTMLLVPAVTGVVMVLTMEYAINPFFGALNLAMVHFFTEAGDAGRGIYSMVIAAGTAFDLGGPINKAAGSVALGLNGMSEGFDLIARELGIVIPPIGVGLAAMLDGKFRKRVFTPEEQTVGKTSLMLGMIGISEGAIPFILKNPKMIPIMILGSVIGTQLAVVLNVFQSLPLPAVWGWFLSSDPISYTLSVFVGSGFIAIALLLCTKPQPSNA